MATWYDVIHYYLTEEVIPYFQDQVYLRFLDIVTAPADNLEMFWLVAPLLVTMFLVQIYFGRHKEEELGWNTAYGNSIVLIFVTVTLFHYLYRTYGLQAMFALEGIAFYKSVFVFIGLLYAFSLIFIDFTHSLHKQIAFFLSSSITVSVSSFIAVVLVYSDVPFDSVTLVTAACLLGIVFIFFKLFRLVIPATERAERILKRRKEIKEELKQEKRIETYRKVKHVERHVREEVGTFAKKVEDTLKPITKLFKK